MGEEEKGFPYIMQHFALESLIMAINGMLELSMQLNIIEYMSQREAFGKTIDKFRH
jgi:alkylation response protein AidB-like acyl-CoA dehydrogenase